MNSLGKPIHSTKEGIKRFWQWFGESKIVNPQGRPLVMYRGTHNEGVESYGENSASIYVSPNRDFIRGYARKTSFALYVKSVKPFMAGSDYTVFKEFEQYLNAPYNIFKRSTIGGLPAWTVEQTLRAWLKHNYPQYDGIYIAENDESWSLALPSASQLKSIYNDGKFSDSNIIESHEN